LEGPFLRPPAALQAATLVLVAVVCAFVANAFAGPQRRLSWIGKYAPVSRESAPATPAPAERPAAAAASSAERAFAPHPDKPWVEISGDDAFLLFSRKTVPFLDARRTSVYAAGHIAGSRPFSVWESDVDEKVKRFFEEGHEPSGPIVVYCSGGDCEDSHMLAQKLYMSSFDNVLVYKDGFPDWETRGLSIHKGSEP
jgi:rhodanese-related sulfurtransferase